MYKKTSIVLFIILLLIGNYKTNFAQDAKSMMQKANSLYQNNNFTGGCENLSGISKPGIHRN